ncbi:hypothetical protein PIIN_09488 [Serendipita indica DSM 11827]|uniref:Uncharacterized protein n=1 Tax=Serendipita indica (strain DSM 11827) TaxID=1109443 RepID=G4TW12_SERID|nr:hypothetical protein PIIN_09488 [Serendipita indica DSM 11827]
MSMASLTLRAMPDAITWFLASGGTGLKCTRQENIVRAYVAELEEKRKTTVGFATIRAYGHCSNTDNEWHITADFFDWKGKRLLDAKGYEWHHIYDN